jgi:hypothetical protein
MNLAFEIWAGWGKFLASGYRKPKILALDAI